MMPPPTWAHQVAVEQFYLLLQAYVREHALGWVELSPSSEVCAAVWHHRVAARLIRPIRQ